MKSREHYHWNCIILTSIARCIISQAYYQWMTYWSIFSIPFFDVDFHPWIKVAILAWLSLPRLQRSFVIDNRVLVPHLDRYEATVDEHMDWSIFSIPFFDVAFHPWIKVAILAWLSLPRLQRSFVIDNRVLVPHLDRYEATVDEHMDDMREVCI